MREASVVLYKSWMRSRSGRSRLNDTSHNPSGQCFSPLVQGFCKRDPIIYVLALSHFAGYPFVPVRWSWFTPDERNRGGLVPRVVNRRSAGMSLEPMRRDYTCEMDFPLSIGIREGAPKFLRSPNLTSNL